MVVTELTVELPLGLSREEAKMLLAIKLYETAERVNRNETTPVGI